MESFYLEEKCTACGTASNCFFRCVQCPVLYGQQMLLCKSCEQKVALYHFWDHTFASVKRWPLKTEELDKIFANPDLQHFKTITTADHGVRCTSCCRDIEGVRYRLANPKEDGAIDYCSLCFKLLRKTQNDGVWLKIRSIFEVEQSAAEEEQILPSPRRPQERASKGYQSEVSSVETSDDESFGEIKTVQTTQNVKQERRRSYYLGPENNYKNHGFYAPDTSYGSPVTNSLPVPPVTLPPRSPPAIRRTKTTGVSPYIKAVMNTAMEKTMLSSLDENSYRGSEDGLSVADHPHQQQFSSLNDGEKVGLQMTQSIYRPFTAEESDEEPERSVSDDSSSDGSIESIETIQSRPESIYDTANMGAEDWNMKFQMILDMPQDTTEEKLARARSLYKLTQSFIATATRIASTIIKEIGMLPAMKTIKPKAFGGLAGGEKFAEEGIFFKLVRDAYGIYGDDQFAFKTAAHELNGLKAYYRTGIKELHFPFMLVIDQRGFRIIATTRLPINKETLKYGSGDGGQTIHKDDKRLNRLMKRAAKIINIKGHVVGMSDHKKKIYGPVDIEAHKGQDGRYYIIDTARVFPPEPPQTNRVGLFIPSHEREAKAMWEPLSPMYHMPAFTAQHYMESIEKQLRSEDEPTDEAEVERVEFVDGTLYYLKYKNKKAPINIRASTLIGRIIEGHAILVFKIGRSVFLYNLLRFSYVKKLEKPLSSDAMTPFGKHNADLNRAEVEDAYYQLIGTDIPAFVESLQESSECFIRGELIRSIHDFGINMRYIGLVRSLIKNETIIKSHLLSEMITRVTKNYVRSRLRAASTSHNKGAIHIVLHHFNLLLGSSQASTFFWHFFIKAQIEAKFGRYGEALNTDELKTECDPRDSINKLCLFQLLQRQLGVEFTEEAQMRVFRNPNILKTKHPFVKTDIASLTVSIKHLFAPELRQQIVNFVSVQCGEDYDRSRKMLTDIFGEGSIEVANVFISEAYALHLQGKYENVRALVDKAFGIFSDNPCTCPLEITIKGFYLRACAAQHFNEDKEIIEANLRAAYDGLVLLTGSTHEKDDGIYAYEMDRPFALLILNKLAILLNEQKRIFESWAISLKFIFVWNNFSFPGTVADCKETFDNEIPLPFIYIYERSRILGDSAGVDVQSFDIDKLINNLINAVPQDSDKIFAWKNHVHMVGLSSISGFCLPPRVLDEYIEQKQYQSEIYTVIGDQLTERFNFPTIQGPSLLTEQPSLTLPVRLLISPSTLEMSSDSELYLAVLRQDQLPKQSTVVPFQAIVAKQRIAQLNHAPLVTFKDLSLHPGAYSYNLITTTTNKNLLAFSIVPDVWGPTLHIIRSNNGLNICTMDLDLDTLNDDINCTDEKVTCLDMWDNILVATKTGVVFEKVAPKDAAKLSEREKLTEKYGWRRLKSFGSWKVVQVCCSDNHQILLTSTKEVFSWGCGDYGQLGHGDAVSRESPRLIERLKRAKIKFVSCGHNRSFAIDEENRLYQWGIDFKFLPELHPFFNKNNIGIVEVCSTPALAPPEQLANLPEVWKQCICVYISDTGEAYWYAGKSKSATGNLEIMEPQDEFIIKVSIGYSHVVFLNNLGEVYASGESDRGQLGLTTAELHKYTDDPSDLSEYSDTLSPPKIAVKVPMPGNKKAVKVMASGFRSYALLEDGTLVKWGEDVVRPRPVVEFQNFSVADFSIGPHGLIATMGEPEKISDLDKEKKKIKKMSFLKSESKPVLSPQDIKIHSISLTPVPVYSSWGDFLQTCGFDMKTLADYLQKFSKVKFDTNRIKVIDSNILDKIGIVDINHQLTILEKIEHIKQLETTHTLETKLNKLISALNDESKRRHEGGLLSSSGGSIGSLPSSLNILQPSSSSTDLTSGMKSPLNRSNKDNPTSASNTNLGTPTNSSSNNYNNSGHSSRGHSRNSSTGGMNLNMIV